MDWASLIRPLLPEIIMITLALLIIILELFIHRKETIAMFSIATIAITAYFIPDSMGETFGGMFISDGYSIFFKYIFFINLILTVLVSIKYLKIERSEFGEYYVLILFSTVGMMIMASAGDLIVLYLGLELMALSTYVLAGFIRHSTRSNEAALKYFLLGAFSSAIILFGISLIYALSGTTLIYELPEKIEASANATPLLIALIFLIAAFGFKVALVPFHVWTPDVYEGAPTSVTAFMSVGPKAAGFAALGRVFIVGLTPTVIQWQWIFIVLSIATMAVGNIVAIQQRNIKRMLAYSSIAHAGYAMLGIVAYSPEGVSAMMNYLLIYTFMNIGAFAVVIMLRSEEFAGEDLDEYKGFAKKHPFVAAVMLLFMFSLTGIPPTAGFIGKFYLFKALVENNLTWLAVVAVIFSVISAYFYLRVVMYMYMYESEKEVPSLSLSPALGLALFITVVYVIVIGVYPSPLLNFVRVVSL
jgi:NADH-quinone oxidoreductase subunit N